MALGFLIDTISPSRQVVFDRAMTRTTEPRKLVARFGDGYEQRLADGVNTIEQKFSATFVNRPRAEIDDITSYFDSLKGVTSFNFTVPDTNATGSPANESTVKVVCESYNTIYVSENCYTCTAELRRVYEP